MLAALVGVALCSAAPSAVPFDRDDLKAATAPAAASVPGGAPAIRTVASAVRDDRGVSLRFAGPPARIVSLLPSLTESVCALGGCARLVGVDRYSDWPASVGRLPKLGGLEDPAVEAIVALRPDVVLATASARVVDRLEALGIRVLVLGSDTRADLDRSLATLAALLGTPEAAARVTARIERELHDAALRVPAGFRGQRVYFEVDPAPYAASGASFIGQVLAGLGLVNTVPAELGAFPKLNPEFVLRQQPELVMASARDLADMAARPGWSNLHALREGRTCGFDPARYELLLRPGPRLGEAAGVIADCLVEIGRRGMPPGAPNPAER